MHSKSWPLRALVIYMISTLLFLTSIELHIHAKDAAVSADHGQSVSISSFSTSLGNASDSDEISVSPDGLLKIQQSATGIIAVFLLLVLVAATFHLLHVAPFRENHILKPLPFYGTPALRAPPQ